MAFHIVQLVLGNLAGGAGSHGLEHAVEVEVFAIAALAHGHGATAAENGRDIATKRTHHHAGHNLVAVRDADAGIEGVGRKHRLHAVGNKLTAGQGELHPLVSHGDTIAHTDEVELDGRTARLAHLVLDKLSHLVEVHVAGNNLIERIANRNKRLTDILIRHARGTHQAAMRRTLNTQLGTI